MVSLICCIAALYPAVENYSEIQTSLFFFVILSRLLLAEYSCVKSNLKANKMLLVMFEDRWCPWDPPPTPSPSYPKGGSCSSAVVLTSSLMYMAFDITEPRWCLYLKNLILFLLINLQKKSHVSIEWILLWIHSPQKPQSFSSHVSSACVLPRWVVGSRFLKYHLEIPKQKGSLEISHPCHSIC